MTSWVAWVLIVVIGVLSCAIILIALLASRTITAMLNHLESQREAHHQHTSQLLDRLMAVDYEQYRAWRASEQAPPGEFLEPEVLDDPWGPMERDEAFEDR